MASNVPINLVSTEDKFSQKCIIPINFLKNANFEIDDYVTIQTSEKKYICRIQMSALPFSCIFVDDVITSKKVYSRKSFGCKEKTNIPQDLACIKKGIFDQIAVKVIFQGNINPINCNKTPYTDVIHKILTGFVFERNSIVNCNGMKFADFFHITHILISETFPETHQYGKLLKSSKVRIIDIMSEEQMRQTDEFESMHLGGLGNAVNVLKLNLIETSSRVFVSGPCGCGKTSFIKKFCTDTKYFFVVIDGLKITNLSSDKCDIIKNQFSNYLKMFPNNTCILFIDHIENIAPYDLKQQYLPLTSVLVNLINSLSSMPVSIIAAAVQKSIINPKVSSLFSREVNLGLPSLQQRKEIMKSLTESLTCDIDYDKISQMTPGFVGHDLFLLIQEAINIKKKRNSEESDLRNLTTEDVKNALINISPAILKTSMWYMKVKPIYWKDIGGMFNIKKRLQMCIEWPLHNPEIFKKVDLPCPRGVLLFGPPGCCKTTLARGLATECKANFFAANPAQVYSPYVGESEKNITELFYQARLCAPSIIFLDELDSLVSQRKLDKKSQGVGEKVLSVLLNEMDGFGTKAQFQNSLNMQKLVNDSQDFKNLNRCNDVTEYHSNDDVIVVAATNRPDLIDDALLRPGRFDIILYVPPPNEEERESILNTLTKQMPIENVDMKNIAEKTHLFSGADLKSLCNEAAMNALRKNISASYVTKENFTDALKKVQPSITRQQIEMYEKLSSKYGTVIK